LLKEPEGGVVIPEQESVDDIGQSVLGLLDAEAAGRAVTVRSAATFAAARSGLRTRIVDEGAIRELGVAENPRVLVACGSHTDGAGRQLDALKKEGVEVRLLDRPADDSTAVERTAQALRTDGIAAIATPRTYIAGTDFEGGQAWMRRLSGAVRTLASGADVIVAKGDASGAWSFCARMLSLFFSLNLLLAAFNLLPVPPLDGSNVPFLFLSPGAAQSYRTIVRQPAFAMIGLVVAWNLFGRIFYPLFSVALKVLYLLKAG
jgi:Zn-dependent protease